MPVLGTRASGACTAPLDGVGQIVEAIERRARELGRGARAPVVRFRIGPLQRGVEGRTISTRPELAKRLARDAVDRNARAGLALLRRPLGLPGPLVNARDRIVNADHRRQRIERAAIERERVDEPSGREPAVGREQAAPGCFVRISIECACGLLGDVAVRLSECVPASRKCRRQRRCRRQLGDGIDEPMIARRLRGRAHVRRGVTRLRRRGGTEQEDRYQSNRTVKPSVRG